MRMSSAALSFVISSLIAVPLSASAQDFYAGNVQSALSTASVLSLNITRSDIVNDALRRRSRAGVDGGSGGAHQTSGRIASPTTASFRPTPDITAKVNGRFLDIMSRGQPDKRGEIEQALRSGAFLRNFDRLMKSYNFDPLNLADVLAAYYVVTWEVLHDMVPTRSEIVGTHDQSILGLSRKRECSTLNNARKQEAAETLKMLSAMALTSYEDFKRRGDRSGLARFQSVIGSSLKQQGVDLADLVITEHGFVVR